MNKRMLAILLSITLALTGIYVSYDEWFKSDQESFGKTILVRGMRGGDVYELQGRLKLLGFYTGPVDGVFGLRTYRAVRLFQYEFGLKIDGLVGPKTKLKLWKATKHWRPEYTAPKKVAKKPTLTRKVSTYSRGGFSANDIRMMANAVYGEARGEPYVGQVAVAAVILNRVKHSSFPNTPSGVIFEPGAFTAVADGQIWLTPNKTAEKAVRDALNGWDPTGGAIYYFNPDTATSGWIWSRPQIKKIGKHIFAK
ncbi:spore cortex-lytic enzyme [Tepidibacillus infernus]|uniref:Spore cortex-lytic enzyme n=1 Tax=Tepidibacillus decaturensis TaxID=1413211 RepID=A0A135L7R1_9BACI|nr:spore cortex-lytic enzyme [Tepidibacillus decaturensis]KXG45018.1 spore cortex-lytic enzyme [Tepidibacillus decaturensis]